MRARVPRTRASHERWLVSYADFITLLFSFFVVMYAFAHANHSKQQQVATAIHAGFNSLGSFSSTAKTPAAQSSVAPVSVDARPSSAEHVKSDLNRIRRELSEQLAAQVGSGAVELKMRQDGLVISLREAGLFHSGSATPMPEATATLHKIAATLDASPYELRIEGHTDNQPIHTAEFASNWELSSARATRIARMMIENEAAPADRISAAGLSEYHPVATNDTPEGRAKNRRVDIVVMPRAGYDLSGPDPAGRHQDSTHWRTITEGDAR